MKKQIFLTLVMLIVLSNFVFSAEFVGSLSTKMKPSRLTDNTIPENLPEQEESYEDEKLEKITIDLDKENKKDNKTKMPEETKTIIQKEIKVIEREVVKEPEQKINWATIIVIVFALIIILILYELIKRYF